MNPLPLSCCGETDASGYLGIQHHCNTSPATDRGGLDSLARLQRIPWLQLGAVSFQWRDHEILHLKTSIGSLGALPVEILHQILHQLDMATLARLQRVSQGSRLAVRSLPFLRALVDYGAEIIDAIAATKTGSLIVCRELYTKFCQPFCDSCHRAGVFLYLLTCKRVCLDCLTKTHRYRPLRPTQANYLYGLRMDTIKSLPALTVPRFRDREDAKLHRFFFPGITGWRLVDHSAVLEHALQTYGSLDVIRARLQARMDAPPRRRRSFSGRSRTRPAVPCVATSPACVVEFSWLDRGSRTSMGDPVLCAACMQSGIPLAQCYFTTAHFKEHEAAMGRVIDSVHVRPAS